MNGIKRIMVNFVHNGQEYYALIVTLVNKSEAEMLANGVMHF